MERPELGCDCSAVAATALSLSTERFISIAQWGNKDEEETSEVLAHSTWEKDDSNYQITC